MTTASSSSAEDLKDEKKNQKEKMMKTIALFLDRIVARQKCNKDPVLRFTLLVNNMCLGLDGLLTYMEIEADDLSPDTSEKIRKSASTLSGELDALFEWIQSPQYTPDHPFGNHVMKEAEKDLSDLSMTGSSKENSATSNKNSTDS